jgi:hypothetical protein
VTSAVSREKHRLNMSFALLDGRYAMLTSGFVIDSSSTQMLYCNAHHVTSTAR